MGRGGVEVAADGTVFFEEVFEGTEGGASAVVRWYCEPRGMGRHHASASALLSVEEGPGAALALVVGVRNAAVCALLPSPARLLAPLNGTCIEHATGGWWSYEVCLGRRVSQFHADGEGGRLQSTVLGSYDWAHGERMAPAGAGVRVEGVELGARATAGLTQLYARGAPGDVRGGSPRHAVVRFECTPLGVGPSGEEVTQRSLSLLSVEEAPTCTYTLIFGTPLVCEHPSVVPSRAQAPPPASLAIRCAPIEAVAD